MAKVSIIIPVHNCAEYLVQSVDSVLNQSFEDFELIVIDDGSTDSTEDVIKRYSKENRIRYIRYSQQKGLSHARNQGVKHSRGDIVAFLDGDDMFYKYKLDRQIKVFSQNKKNLISYTNEVYFRDDQSKGIMSTRYHFSGDIFYFIKKCNFIHISTVMARRELMLQYMFDENLPSHEDWELFLRIAYSGIWFCYMHEPLSKIRIRPHSMTLNKMVMDRSRKDVGTRAKRYWKEFKKNMSPVTQEGRKSIIRYIWFKFGAFLTDFPKNKRFNKPVPQEIF